MEFINIAEAISVQTFEMCVFNFMLWDSEGLEISSASHCLTMHINFISVNFFEFMYFLPVGRDSDHCGLFKPW